MVKQKLPIGRTFFSMRHSLAFFLIAAVVLNPSLFPLVAKFCVHTNRSRFGTLHLLGNAHTCCL